MPFRDLIGQRDARAVLQGALRSGCVSHAYLFVGPEGVGRRAAALAFAQALLCRRGGDDACGSCDACRKVAAGAHPDLRVIAPGGRTESGAERRAVGIEQVRDLKRDAAYPPYEARWKVFIVEDAEAMRAEAANSLLKVLEEPPSQSVIVLISESAAALLPTIVSRSQIVRFAFVPAADIAAALSESAGVPPDHAPFLAALSGGRPGVALREAAEGQAALTFRQEVVRTLGAVAAGSPVRRLEAADAVSRRKDELDRWLDTALLWLRDVAVWQTTPDPALLVNLDRRDQIAAWADRARPDGVRAAAAAIEAAKTNLRANVNPRLVVEHLFAGIKLAPGGALRPPGDAGPALSGRTAAPRRAAPERSGR
ncbi:MAG TPA: DNA polymerase III subunit delta' [bacterium]|nr:DNA polymerase III subunit delta' [bacterium]